jgi:hypothetical protein
MHALALSLAALFATGSARAQAAATATAEYTPVAPDLHVSPVMGFNFVLDYTAQHNSATGWAQIVTPDLLYRFNRHLSVTASVPWYPSIKAFIPTTKAEVTTYPLDSAHNLLGDATLAGQLEAEHNTFSYLFTTTVGFDTGNAQFGLSAKTTTYNFTNHLEYAIGPFTPDIELGYGDNSALATPALKRIYTAVGAIANFQAGTDIDLPFNLSLDLEAYEELPIGNQNVYGTVTRKNKKGKTVTKQVLEGTGAAEDNGFTSELDIPLGHYLTLNGSYDRSLIQGLDTAAVGLTWMARAPKIPKID